MSLRNKVLSVLFAAAASAGAGTAQPAPAPASAAAAEEAAPQLRLEVSLSERTLTVYQGERAVGSYPVSVGQPKHPTPEGQFRIRRVIWNPRWVPPKVGWARGKKPVAPGDPNNPMGRVKMFFQEPDYYIHGTNAEKSLGQAASHGCIRMAQDDVAEVARLVMEHGGEPREPGWFERVMNFVRRTEEVRLSQPVALIVR